MAADRKACIKAGMNDYLTKPIDAEALREMMEKYLCVEE